MGSRGDGEETRRDNRDGDFDVSRLISISIICGQLSIFELDLICLLMHV